LNDTVRGWLYCVTDVQELHDWHVAACDAHPLFRRLAVSTDEENASKTSTIEAETTTADPCVCAMITVTQEGQTVDRNHGQKYYAVYERIANSEAPAVVDASNFLWHR
jgi:tRNA (guanine-N7-)-methyltransferase